MYGKFEFSKSTILQNSHFLPSKLVHFKAQIFTKVIICDYVLDYTNMYLIQSKLVHF
jgi:hypothetical protein